MSFESAFQAFLQSFEDACVCSTKASWGGSGYSVEIKGDGTYRILWDNQIGNRYDSPGLILGIPALNEEEWDEDPNRCFFDNAREAIIAAFNEAVVHRQIGGDQNAQ